MKKISILLCCALIMQMFCSCTANKEEFQEPVNFYYGNKEIFYNSPAGVIQAELREGNNFHGNLTAFLRAYLLGPMSSDLYSFVPSDVYVVSCEVNEGYAVVVLSSQFSNLSGVELSAACSALLMTLHDYTGIETLELKVKDSQLDGKSEIIIGINDIVLMDTAVSDTE